MSDNYITVHHHQSSSCSNLDDDHQGEVTIIKILTRVKLVCHTDWSGMVIPLGPDLILLVVCTYYAVVTR